MTDRRAIGPLAQRYLAEREPLSEASLAEFAERIGLSESAARYKVTHCEYGPWRALKQREAKMRVGRADPAKPLKSLAEHCGFSSPVAFGRFLKQHGLTIGALREVEMCPTCRRPWGLPVA